MVGSEVIGLVPMEALIEQVPPSVLLQPVRTETERFLFAVGVKDQIEMLDEYLSTLKARPLELPRWLPVTPEKAVAAIDQRGRREPEPGRWRVLPQRQIHTDLS